MDPRKRTEPVTTMAALLSNGLRVAIVSRLLEGPRIVGDLVETLGESQATVSKQLALLREGGVLACRPDGRCREYALADPSTVAAALDALARMGALAEMQAEQCRRNRARRRAP